MSCTIITGKSISLLLNMLACSYNVFVDQTFPSSCAVTCWLMLSLSCVFFLCYCFCYCQVDMLPYYCVKYYVKNVKMWKNVLYNYYRKIYKSTVEHAGMFIQCLCGSDLSFLLCCHMLTHVVFVMCFFLCYCFCYCQVDMLPYYCVEYYAIATATPRDPK